MYLYNTSWMSENYPTCWKASIHVPIHKPGKDPALPSAYRPIALLTCIRKLMKHRVTRRLSWWLIEKNLLREDQFGFQPHRSTLDVLSEMDFHISDTYRQERIMLSLIH